MGNMKFKWTNPPGESGTFGCGAVLTLLIIFASVCFCVVYLLAWLAVTVFAGFGVVLPFWPTAGAIILINMLLGGVSFGRRN